MISFLLQVAESTAAAGKFVHKADFDSEEFEVQSLRNYVIAIPTMNAIHGQDSWRASHMTSEYGDHSAWNVGTIIDILQKFFKASKGTSLPDLAEYNWRLDKVCCVLPPPPALAVSCKQYVCLSTQRVTGLCILYFQSELGHLTLIRRP